jgi:hypothetical protein
MQLYTKEVCKEAAFKCSSTYEFRARFHAHYKAATRNKWLPEVTSHFTIVKHPKSYWTKELCAKEAAKYTIRSHFKKAAITAYLVAKENGWLDEFIPIIYKANYCGYSIINHTTRQAYVGITRCFEKRINQHKSSKNTTLSKAIVNLPDTVITKLTSYVINPKECKDFETTLYEMYKEKGFTMLNSVSNLGNIGSSYNNPNVLTKEEATAILKTIPDFKTLITHHKKLREKIRTNNWEDCAPHIKFPNKNNYWTKERCLEAAKTYKTLKEFKHNELTAYRTICRYGWLPELHKLLTSYKPNGYWFIKENCLNEAKKYLSRSEFAKKAVGAYSSAIKNNWLEEACSHMTTKRKSLCL